MPENDRPKSSRADTASAALRGTAAPAAQSHRVWGRVFLGIRGGAPMRRRGGGSAPLSAGVARGASTVLSWGRGRRTILA
ncbi:MAG TPA: hypothetical protein VMM17_09915, partial [Gemmatimonadaceae bacterium]|nr:hypothetical protein [Gemmatimonadaceae bacterium]